MYEHIKCVPVTVAVEAAVVDTASMVEDWPWRGPATVPYALRPYIEGKRFCDLGCGGGDLAWSASRWASHVLGVEKDKVRHRRSVTLHRDGEPNPLRQQQNVEMRQLDYFADFPKADVYYFWPNDPNTMDRMVATAEQSGYRCLLAAGARLSFLDAEREGKTLSYSKGERSCSLLKYTDAHKGKVLSFPFKERPVMDGWPSEGTWVIALIPLGGYEI